MLAARFFVVEHICEGLCSLCRLTCPLAGVRWLFVQSSAGWEAHPWEAQIVQKATMLSIFKYCDQHEPSTIHERLFHQDAVL